MILARVDIAHIFTLAGRQHRQFFAARTFCQYQSGQYGKSQYGQQILDFPGHCLHCLVKNLITAMKDAKVPLKVQNIRKSHESIRQSAFQRNL